MINPDKIIDQAQGYRLADDSDALPLTGPGRWAHLDNGIVLYANDANVVFVQAEESSVALSLMSLAVSKAYEARETASQAFDRLRGELRVITGNLSALA